MRLGHVQLDMLDTLKDPTEVWSAEQVQADLGMERLRDVRATMGALLERGLVRWWSGPMLRDGELVHVMGYNITEAGRLALRDAIAAGRQPGVR